MNTQSATANVGMDVSTFENPMGIDGFEFVEYAAPEGQAGHLHDYFKRLGFVQVARHKTRPISTYRQGDCTFLINEDPDSFAARFAAEHGPSACGFAIRVNKLAEWARATGMDSAAVSRANVDAGQASSVRECTATCARRRRTLTSPCVSTGSASVPPPR